MSDIAAEAWPGSRAASGAAVAAFMCAVGATLAFAIAGAAWIQSAPDVAPAPAPTTVSAATAPATWLEVLKPVQIFSLEAPQFREESLFYTARRLVSTGAREDTLAYGTVAGNAPMLRFAILRGALPDAVPGLDRGLSRLAERQGFEPALGTRRGVLTTRFGRFETATLRIPGRSTGCDGLHLSLTDPALSIDGIVCGTARTGLACLIDRIDLASAGEDARLADFFAAAELRRNDGCAGMRLRPDVAHAAWLDGKRATPSEKMRRSKGFNVADP